MKRREFITLVGGGAIAWPVEAWAQQTNRQRVVGILVAFPAGDKAIEARVSAFRNEIRNLGWTEKANIRMEERWPSDDMDRLRAEAAELINLKPDAILVSGRRAVAVLKQQTSTIPIVFAGVGDPVETGLVASFNRPGGNFTGFTLWEYSFVGKMLELLKQIAPDMKRAALVFNPDNPATVVIARNFEAAAEPLAVRPTLLPVHTTTEIEHSIEAFAREPLGAVVFPSDVTTTIHRDLIVSLVAKSRLPAIYGDPTLVASGGLMSYGPDRMEIFRHAASYVDRILRGEKPGDLPVQVPTKYELLLNRKTAIALNLAVPTTLLAVADEVIE